MLLFLLEYHRLWYVAEDSVMTTMQFFKIELQFYKFQILVSFSSNITFTTS